MKKLMWIVLCLSLSVEAGLSVETKSIKKVPPETPEIVCPSPHFVVMYLKNLRSHLHSFLKSHVKTEIEGVYIPDVTLTRSFMNSKGHLICGYGHSGEVPLIFVSLEKAHINLENLQRPPAELGKPKK